MKTMKKLVITLSILIVGAALALAADAPKKPVCDGKCCPATVEGCKNCEKCPCCKKAAEKGKVCPRCHKPEKKADQAK